jgi:hypothetical protein
MRHWALEKLRDLEKQHGVRSVAFENLGPPRPLQAAARRPISAAGLLHDGARGGPPRPRDVVGLARLLLDDPARQAEIVSIGIPDSFPDGRLMRGPECKVPEASHSEESLAVTPARVDSWAMRDGWTSGKRTWRPGRFASSHPAPRWTRSRPPRARPASCATGILERRGCHPAGKLVGWVFATEEKGARMK